MARSRIEFTPEQKTAIGKAFKKAFNRVKPIELAKALNCSRIAIYQYAGAHKACGPQRAKEIQTHTKGIVKAKVLRPDIFE